jgi:lysophospholipase L1-like esterase
VVPPALEALAELMLKPGATFDLKSIPPETFPQLMAYQKNMAARQDRDWPNLCRYAADNAAGLASGHRPRVVFFGDSITENWRRADPAMFSDDVLDRGISGQTTPQMLLRTYPDVIALRPRVVHIMAGTNDISGNTGPETDQTIVDNLRAMIVLATANRIAVVLGSITPSSHFVGRPDANPSARIVRLNRLLRDLADELRVTWVDYHAPLSDAEGGMRQGLSNDGLHLNRAGYAIIRPLTERAIAQALRAHS